MVIAGFALVLATLARARAPCPPIIAAPRSLVRLQAHHVTGECSVSSHPPFHLARAPRRQLLRELGRRQSRIDHLLDANAAAAEEILRLKVELIGARARLEARRAIPARPRKARIA